MHNGSLSKDMEKSEHDISSCIGNPKTRHTFKDCRSQRPLPTSDSFPPFPVPVLPLWGTKGFWPQISLALGNFTKIFTALYLSLTPKNFPFLQYQFYFRFGAITPRKFVYCVLLIVKLLIQSATGLKFVQLVRRSKKVGQLTNYIIDRHSLVTSLKRKISQISVLTRKPS